MAKLLFLVSFLCLFSLSFSAPDGLVRTGTAFLRETAGVPSLIMATVDFYQSSPDSDVVVDLFAYGNNHFLANGEAYGVHIHEYGDVSERQGELIGPHFVGNGYPVHGCPPNPIRHAGDLGNWATTAEGMLNAYITVPYLQTYASQNNSIIGRSVAINAILDGCDDEAYLGPKMVIGTIGIPLDAPPGVGINFEPDALVARLTGTSACFVCTGTVWIWKEDPDNNTETPNSVIHIRGRAYAPPTASNGHGWTINEFGDIQAKNGAFVGGHWDNGMNDPHGLFPSVPRHLGDLGNNDRYVNPQPGQIVTAKWLDITLPDVFELKDIVGRSVIVWENMDRGTDCPEGGLGEPWIMGVLGIASPDTEPAVVSKSAILVNQTIGWMEPCSNSGVKLMSAVVGLFTVMFAQLFI